MYHNNSCPKCGHKLATDMTGREWCPSCVGRQMGEQVSKKLKLAFPKNIKKEN